eukprot:14472110-Ditylum_brightwellii.AAC.1
MDVKTRKLLTTHGFHHPKANINYLYLHRLKGGRGPTGLEDTHDAECSALTSYVIKSADPLTVMVRETTPPTQKFLLKFASAPKFTTPDLTNMKHAQELCTKPLHGKFFANRLTYQKLTWRDPTAGSSVRNSDARLKCLSGTHRNKHW